MRKLQKIALVTIFALMGTVFFYGMYEYPDAPIRSCDRNVYCGKMGKAHTKHEFENFKIWENTLLYGLPFGMIALFLLRERKKH